jgi:succinate dehydrogenase / fumarate reductase membrane anchor subunit
VAVAVCGTIIFFQLAFNGMHGLNTWLLFPILAFGLWHTFSGFKMITDDYVRCRALRFALLIAYWGFGVVLLGLGLSFAI